MTEKLATRAHGGRNLLPWVLALCGAVFAADLTYSLNAVVGIGYLLAVALSLSSNRSWHIQLVAAVSVLLIVVAPVISGDGIGWAYLQSQIVAIFGIVATSVFGTLNSKAKRCAKPWRAPKPLRTNAARCWSA
jgi:hypothetical protein